MSLSDLILFILILAFTALVLWVLDINPYTDKFQAYTQECDNMILENTYCKGDWHDLPITNFKINKLSNQVIYKRADETSLKSFEGCSITDRKNWTCSSTDYESNTISVVDGLIQFEEKSTIRQITRLEWLQNKFLASIK